LISACPPSEVKRARERESERETLPRVQGAAGTELNRRPNGLPPTQVGASFYFIMTPGKCPGYDGLVFMFTYDVNAPVLVAHNHFLLHYDARRDGRCAAVRWSQPYSNATKLVER
jgi:hypothetical protein